MNVWQYGALSSALLAAVVGNALIQREQFYPACVYLTNSNANMLVMYNSALVMTVMFGKVVSKVFFGQLRAIEVEHLYEESWYNFTETLLALSMFRNEFDAAFIAWFTFLLFLKVFHLLTADRVDYMEQTPILGHGFHVRMVTFLFLLGAADLTCILYSAVSVMQKGPSMYLLFGFEFTVLMTAMLTSLYFTRLVAYMIYFCILMKYYSVPLYILRDVYMTFRSFAKRVQDMMQYYRATANMNERYPDATPEELAAGDSMCIICRDELTTAKKLPCGHIFHMHCLRSWLERQQLCPTCRRPVINSQYAAARARAQQTTDQTAPSPETTNATAQTTTSAVNDTVSAHGVTMPPPPAPPSHLHTTTATTTAATVRSPSDLPTHEAEKAERHALAARLAHLQAMHVTLDTVLQQLSEYTSRHTQ